jgi:hypothetical protein
MTSTRPEWTRLLPSAPARSGPYADKDFSALLEYACELGGVETPRLPADIKPSMT